MLPLPLPITVSGTNAVFKGVMVGDMSGNGERGVSLLGGDSKKRGSSMGASVEPIGDKQGDGLMAGRLRGGVRALGVDGGGSDVNQKFKGPNISVGAPSSLSGLIR
jgi:hypothetical protein